MTTQIVLLQIVGDNRQHRKPLNTESFHDKESFLLFFFYLYMKIFHDMESFLFFFFT